MEDSMAVDVVLWFILAAMIALVWCGCLCTAPERRRHARLRHDPLEREFDRAA
ncbi:MAG TPA: hypothetical protein VL048_06260 [Xanthobacteraceae bacterium]|jgi:hypothetical protein|nr:hypothetical protein [Xanthobacteraceae bacterium]